MSDVRRSWIPNLERESHSLTRGFEILALLSTAATFILQILTRTRAAAVVPYAVMIWGAAGCWAAGGRRAARGPFVALDAWVGIYLATACARLIVRLAAGGPVAALLADGFNYVLPALFYWYYRKARSDGQGDGLLLGLVAAGIFSALFFVYDSAYRSFLRDVPWFARSAHQYSMTAMGFDPEQMNLGRLSFKSRASGVMVSHSHSATWIAIGGFAGFTRFGERRFSEVFLATLLVLILGLNYTAILAFLVVTILCYKSPLFLKRGSAVMLDPRVLSRRTFLAVLIATFMVGVAVLGGALGSKIIQVIRDQTAFIFSPGAGLPFSYADLTLRNVSDFLGRLRSDRALLLLGAIPSAQSPWPVGGDTGFLDSVSFLGVPLWIVSVVFFLTAFLQRGRYLLQPGTQLGQGRGQIDDRARLRFLMAVLLFVLIMDLHYNVWLNKSIQIVLFASLGYAAVRRTAAEGLNGS
jgi:hypothetical protein